jgi:quercetin dioxygenase-like cupin family protein
MEPVVVAPGAGEIVQDADGKRVALVVGRPELVAVINEYAPGARGPEVHVHREHIDSFFVLEGALAFVLGAKETTVPAGGWIALPPGVAHAFEAPAGARFLNLHARGSGFDAFLRAGADGDPEDVDQWPVPADGGRPATDAIVLRPGDEAEAISLGGSAARFLLEQDDLSLTALDLAPGFPGPVPHRHARMTDSFLVLGGRPAFRVGEARLDPEPGTWLSVPPGNVHTFWNDSSEPAQMLNAMAPGGLEQYLKEVAAAARPDAPPDPAAMAEIASRYDFAPA